ncbi:MAG: AMP-binding protein [Pseudomonadota bacterium]
MTEITRAETWDALRAAHRWQIPDRYNLAWDMCGKWAQAEPDRLALIHVTDQVRDYTYGDLWRLSAQLANVLAAHGIKREDRIGLLLPQRPETVLTHLAAYRLGAVIVPLFVQFGADGLAFRLSDSGARAIVTDHANLPKVAQIRDRLVELAHVFSADGPADGALDLPTLMQAARDQAPVADTLAEDPSFLSYTSGTTGPPKGALHAQRVLLGHIPGVQTFYDFWPQEGDRIWTPSDWAWLGGLGNVMMPALRMGVPLIAHAPARFEPDAALDLMRRHRVTSSFLAPTALKLMRQATVPEGLALRAVGSGGESLGAAMLEWGREALGLTINEFYGQTECNLVLGNNWRLFDPKPGSMGRALPGSHVAVLDGTHRLGPDQTGEIAIRTGDPAMFLRYWNQPETTAQKYVTASDGEVYMMTGDEGRYDGEGCFFFASRTDDVITSSGYRIGPSEIEDCLNRHPAVAMSACIGVPDPVRTESVKAFVVRAAGNSGNEGDPDALAAALIAHVRTRLGPHVAPREIAWIDALPMTARARSNGAT